MTMLTTCPHCQTRFRVPESLRQAAPGRVRCGVCSEAF
ncbi:MAG: zinc-ribbon domain-containing protein, partial [Steroidobacteraceae bacterium]